MSVTATARLYTALHSIFYNAARRHAFVGGPYAAGLR